MLAFVTLMGPASWSAASSTTCRAAALRDAHCRTSLPCLCSAMARVLRDVILVVCALICAGTAIYVVYNIELFKHRYELQFMGQPDQFQ